MAVDKGAGGALLQRVIEISDSDSAYSVPSHGDILLYVDSSSAAVTITLPALSVLVDGNRVTIIDANYSAQINNITVNPTGADTIHNTTSTVIKSSGTTLTFRANFTTTNWHII